MWIGLYLPTGRRGTDARAAPAVAADDPQTREDEAALAQCAAQFTPLLAIESAGLLLLDVGASLRLFGGPDALLARLRAECAMAGVRTVQLSTAPNPTAAALLARAADGHRADTAVQRSARLGPLSVHGLSSAAPHRSLLQTLGVRTLRDLEMLPRSGLVRRFGRPLVDELDRAFGRSPDLRMPWRPPPIFDARLELPAAVETSSGLLFGARHLLGRLSGWLQASRMGTRCLHLEAEHDDAAPTALEWRMAEPTRDPERLHAVLRERLASVRLGEPAHALRMRCLDARPLADVSADLFSTAPPQHETLGRLVERLRARLGTEGLLRLRCVADHRPEAAYRVEWIEGLDSRGRPVPVSERRPSRPVGPDGHDKTRPPGLPRPLWLLRSPQRLLERASRPIWHGPLSLLAGPERIEGGWWDGDFVERDYFVACNDDHEMVWIFRSRTAHGDGAGHWYLHGLFG